MYQMVKSHSFFAIVHVSMNACNPHHKNTFHSLCNKECPSFFLDYYVVCLGAIEIRQHGFSYKLKYDTLKQNCLYIMHLQFRFQNLSDKCSTNIPFQSMFFLGVLCCYSNSVKETETHCSVSLSMVTWGSINREKK